MYARYAARGNLRLVEHVMEAELTLMPVVGKRRDGEVRKAGRAGKFYLGRVHEALHHPRNGAGSGQEFQRGCAGGAGRCHGTRDRRDRDHHLLPALSAGADRGHGGRGAVQRVRAGAVQHLARGIRRAGAVMIEPGLWYRPS